MKTELQTLASELQALVGQLPDDPPHRFRLTLPWPASGISSPDGYDLVNWGSAGVSLFPGAVYDQGYNSLTIIGNSRPAGVTLTHQTQDTTTMEWSEMLPVLHEWVDLGPVDAAADTIAQQAARITELEQMIAIEVATDAAQGQ